MAFISPPRLALGAAVATCLSVPLAAVLPGGLDYDRGFAPAWATVVASLLAVLCILAVSGARPPGPRLAWGLVAGWTAVALLLWSAGGVVLDAFRAFFWVTGIPAGTFAQVDWPGALTRALSLAAAAATVAVLLAARRAPRTTAWPGYAAFALCFPYPLLKLYWSLGGTTARPAVYHEGFPAMELITLGGLAVLSLALVQDWGRAVPRRLLLVAAWVAAAALVSMGALAVFGTLSQLTGMTDGPVEFGSGSAAMVGLVYGSWLLLGVALGAAALGRR
ncbi:hypothetical protein [Spongiactinospora sp. TRM90649]|uniref:hypothetical protein n=1 Tax=Spongiactinospora sp. TRM90649 TaxID=3031114 RepID=UPI0023F8A11C|nr:hypothetical protein [Spongiactinospora sp. TRM90649]MDF5756458.1 hypothetical protein [Spongiactinospora sp. TRM90649]